MPTWVSSWSSLRANGRALDHALGENPDRPPISDARRVLMFAYHPRWLPVCALIAAAMARLGHDVHLAYLPYLSFSLPHSRRHAVLFWAQFGRRLARASAFSTIRLDRSLPATTDDEALAQIAESQAAMDVRWLTKREVLDTSAAQFRGVLDMRTQRNLRALLALDSLVRRNTFDRFVVPNGQVFEFGAAHKYLTATGRHTTSFEWAEPFGEIAISHRAPAACIDTDLLWSVDEPHRLSSDTRRKLEALLAMRRGQDATEFRYYSQPVRYMGQNPNLLVELGVPADRRPVFVLCPNISWDSAVYGRDCAFSSMVEWVEATVRHPVWRDQATLVVRVHPSEQQLQAAEPVGEIVRAAIGANARIRLIEADEPVNTYELMEACDYGLVYNSTTGLEMAMLGKPVIVAGAPHYGSKEFTLDAATTAEYFRYIDRAVERDSALLMSPRQIELAWCYAAVYFFAWAAPFPWHSSTLTEDVKAWPLERVVGADGMSQFATAFSRLEARS